MATKATELAAAERGEGCLGKAADDEPVFILRAQDQLASSVVREWADRAFAVGTPPEKVREAEALAGAMDVWRATHGGGKVPD